MIFGKDGFVRTRPYGRSRICRKARKYRHFGGFKRNHLWLNPYNTGRFIVAEVLKSDVRKTKEQLSEQVVNEFYEKWEDVAAKADSKIEKPPFAMCDRVELIAEKKKYAKYGIHKGDVGIVCFDEAVSDGLEVAFPTFDENGDELGDVSFVVLIEDLKLVKKA